MSLAIEKHINLVLHDAPIANGSDIGAHHRGGLLAVGQFLANVIDGSYAMPIPAIGERQAIRLPVGMTEEPPNEILEILTSMVQQVFDRVASGEKEADVLNDCMVKIHEKFTRIPGPTETEEEAAVTPTRAEIA